MYIIRRKSRVNPAIQIPVKKLIKIRGSKQTVQPFQKRKLVFIFYDIVWRSLLSRFCLTLSSLLISSSYYSNIPICIRLCRIEFLPLSVFRSASLFTARICFFPFLLCWSANFWSVSLWKRSLTVFFQTDIQTDIFRLAHTQAWGCFLLFEQSLRLLQ